MNSQSPLSIHRQSVEQALTGLQSRAEGLSTQEAQRRRQEFGPNEIHRPHSTPLWIRFLREFTHFFAVILWVGAGLAFLAERQDPGQGMATLGGAIIGVIFLNGVFSFWQERRAEQAVTALQKLIPFQVKTLRDGTLDLLPASELVPGDILLLSEGDKVPADCRVIESVGLRVNNATVTGESLPQSRQATPATQDDPLHCENLLLAGTVVVAGQGRAAVFATGMHTEFGKIAHLTQTAPDTQTPLQQQLAQLSRVIAILSLGLGGLFFLLGQSLGLSFWQNLLFAIGIIVANVPEGLLPTVTLALAIGSQRMAKRNALIRHLPSVETLGSTTVICTDKTGTLTQNRMTVRRLFLQGQYFAPDDLTNQPALVQHYRPFFETAWLCHDLKRVERDGQVSWQGDPMEVALVTMAQQAIPTQETPQRQDEIPFESERRRLSTVYARGETSLLYTKGALETLLPLCTAVQDGPEVRPLTPQVVETFLQAQERMGASGLRVLACAYRALPRNYERDHLEEEMILTGLVGLEDPPRPEVPEALRRCQAAGIRVIMITGDHPHTAQAIGREIGLLEQGEATVLTGEQLTHLSDTQLQLALDSPHILFARMRADQKLRVVQALQRKGEIVAVTGDGVNDAPALKNAAIGIAMGLTGTDVAREAADMVLLDDNFASIVSAVEEGRTVFANIRKFLTYVLCSNVAELLPYLAFVLWKVPLALTIIQVLMIDLGTDMLPALALGAEAPEADTMRRPPRSRRDRLWDGRLLARAYLWLGLMEGVAGLTAFFLFLHAHGWQYGQMFDRHDPLYRQATTVCLMTIVMTQVANVFLCRSETASVFTFPLVSNRFLLGGIAFELALLGCIVYTPWGNMLFGTLPFPPLIWLQAILLALGMLLLEEARKGLFRRRNR